MKTVRLLRVGFDLQMQMIPEIARFYQDKKMPISEYWKMTSDWRNYNELPKELFKVAKELKSDVKIAK